ncbi:MAG: cysteine--tRNA ligase, partial [Acidimicrobiia bacterium]
ADLADPLASLAGAFGVAAAPGAAMVEGLLERRRQARDGHDWATADAIRDRLGEIGIVIEDTADGARWHRR